MAELGVHRTLLLVISLTKCLEGTKLLADFKKCGDLECETLISRVLAMRDYRGSDCRYLNFTKGEEISVYVKLAGEREDLWAGSKGKDFGYFPRDAVQIEEVFITEEVEVSTKESDFLCLLGVSYTFENEDSELNSDDGKNIHLYEEDENQKSGVYESDFQTESGFYSTSESTFFEDQFPASEAPEDIRSTSESKPWEGVEVESMKEDSVPEVDHIPSPLPKVNGWFGFGRELAEEKSFESVIEPLQESSFQSRKIAGEDKNDLEELNNEPPNEQKQEPELKFDSVPKKQSELGSESENFISPEATSWFGGGFKSYLGFGGEDTGLELSKESNSPLQDVPNLLSSEEEPAIPCTEKEDTIANDTSILKPSWFDIGFGMLGFVYTNEDKISDDGKSEEGDGGDGHEHLPTSKFDPDKEQEIKIIEIMETADQVSKERVLEKTDDSDTLPYFKKFLYNFDSTWNFQDTPKETELPFSKQIQDENDIIENDETEEFSADNYPTDNMKVTMLKSRSSQSGGYGGFAYTGFNNYCGYGDYSNQQSPMGKDPDMASKIESPGRIHKEVLFKTPSSKDIGEKSKTSLGTDGSAQAEIDRSMENTLPNSQMVSNDYFLSSQEEDASECWSLKYLFQIDICDFINSTFSPIIILTERRVDITWEISPEK